jgi:hypothetical protein
MIFHDFFHPAMGVTSSFLDTFPSSHGGRGYPDISATGANVPIIFQKRLTMVPGMWDPADRW